MRVNIRVAVLSCLVSSVALAQPAGDDGTGAPPPGPAPAPVMVAPPPMQPMQQPPPPPPASHVDQGVIDDANAGRSWLSPTALTEPAGTWSFSDFELLLASISYSPTDQFSLSATTLLPITSDFPFWLLVNGKYQIVKAGNVRIVAQAAISYISVEDNVSDSSGNTSSNRQSVTGAVVGGAATYCIDSECHSTLTGYLGAGFAHEDQSAVPFVFSGALALSVNKHVKILLEGDSGFMAGSINDQIDGFLAWYGIRFTSKEIGVDLGFTRPICDGCSTGPLLLGVPFVSFTYRSIK